MMKAKMTKAKERQLVRLLHGELAPEEARELERELADASPEVRAANQRLVQVWSGLELPPSEVPADFSTGVMAAARNLARERAEGAISWSLAPAWARGGAAAALVTGLLLGATFGRGFEAPSIAEPTAVVIADADADATPLSLAEVYWLALEESEGQLTVDGEGTP